MALRENRQVFETLVDRSCSGVAERGGIMSFDPIAANLVMYADAVAVSGQVAYPAGLLLDDVEALNFFNHPEYRQRNVVPQGSVVGLACEGDFETDFVETTLAGQSVGTYRAGDVLYLADNGKVSRNNGTLANGATAKRPVVGRALSAVDADGFLKIRLEV
jgi:hypothetical protein